MTEILKEIDRLQEEINKYRPLPESTAKQLKEYYRVGLTYTSNALEGNSLTETETKIVLEDGITIGGKPIKDYYEALGHSDAYDYIYKLVKEDIVFTEDNVKKLHKLFYHRIDEAKAGKYRKEKVFISGSKYSLPNPERVQSLMDELMEKLATMAKLHPVDYSAIAHKELVFIHPFVDGNGRVTRLFMNLILLQKGYCIAIIPPILRRDYINALEKAHTNDSEFREFIARAVRESQRDYLRLLK